MFARVWPRKEKGGKVPGHEKLLREISRGRIPRHIAIIMDGNGRWAQARGLPRIAGHRAGVEALKEVVKTCLDLGVGFLTLYAFSTENWKRPREEVDALMMLLVEYLQKQVGELHAHGIKVNALGSLDEIPRRAREEMRRAMELTKDNARLVVSVALNYGGRAEIVRAARTLAGLAKEGVVDPGSIDEDVFSRYLYTAGMPDPDLLIRPSGEMRVSNYLLWQSAYTEFWFTPIYWPDFRPGHLLLAIRDYQKRDRRFGGVEPTGG